VRGAADIMEEIQALSAATQNPAVCQRCLTSLRAKMIEICVLNRQDPKYVELFKIYNHFVKAMGQLLPDLSCRQVIIPCREEPCRGLSPFVMTPYTSKIVRVAEFKTVADLKVLDFVGRTGLPCCYEDQIRAIVPASGSFPRVQNDWVILRNPLRDIIRDAGVLPSALDSALWTNSATSVDELLAHERIGGFQLVELATRIREKTGGKAHFGPDNINLTKSRESIEGKIKRTIAASGCSPLYALQHIEDGVRGTLSFATPEALQRGLREFIGICEARGLEIDSSNIWNCDEDYAGYVDIDFRLRLPVGSGLTVMAELQFHLDDFYDGTRDCPVSRAHKVYEILRMIPTEEGNPTTLTAEELRETSRLFFTAALFQAHVTRSDAYP
jgi:hypothetical protein